MLGMWSILRLNDTKNYTSSPPNMPPKFKKPPRKYVASVKDAYGQMSVGNPNLTINERTSSNSELHAAAPLVQRSLFQDTLSVDNEGSTDIIMSQIRPTTSNADITLPQVQTEHTPSSDVPKQTPSITAGFDASSATRRGCGAGRCLKFDKMVKETRKMKIVFNNNKRKPAQHSLLFSEGVGVVVRTNAKLEGVGGTHWLVHTKKHLMRGQIRDLKKSKVGSNTCQVAESV